MVVVTPEPSRNPRYLRICIWNSFRSRSAGRTKFGPHRVCLVSVVRDHPMELLRRSEQRRAHFNH